jgi:hypothetical protein
VPASKGGARRVESRTRTGVSPGARPVADCTRRRKRAPVRRKSSSSIKPPNVAIWTRSMTGAATLAVAMPQRVPRRRGRSSRKGKKSKPIRLRKIGEDAERHGGGRDKPKGGLAVGVKIKDDTRTCRDRQPQKRPPQRRLRLKSLFEQLERNAHLTANLPARLPALPRRPPAIAVSDTPAMELC